ncbi:MAG: glutathione S-transferase family protein, partial [Solirubrobacterales bacterium]
PVLGQLPVAEAAEVGLRVADIDREQHARDYRPDRIRAVEAKLYVIPGSHPSRTAMTMLDRKGIAYKRVDLMPVISKGVLRAVGFSGITVPALKIDGNRIQGSREIGHELDRLVPEPPLYPSEPDARAAVEQAEGWGDESLQPVARRVLWNALRRDRSPLASYSEGARLGIPIGLAVKTAAPIVALAARLNEATDEHVRADLAALPGMLQRIDDWIAAGVLGGAELNAADLQIATSVRLLITLEDLRPAIAARPAGELAMRVAPDYPGETPPVLPPAWLRGLREPSAAPAA